MTIKHISGFMGLAIPMLAWALTSAALNGQTWIQLNPTGQIPILSAGGGAYDPSSNQLMIFGGGNRTNSVWVLSHADGTGGSPVWTQLSPMGTPPSARGEHTLVYDPGSNRLVVFAGCDAGCQNLLNDVWVLTNANGLEAMPPEWIQLSPAGTLPAPRAALQAIYDPGTNRMTIFGGCTRGQFGCDVPQNDTWVLANATGLGGRPTWIQLKPAGGLPGPRDGYAAALDPDTGRMIVFGGTAGNEGINYSDTWILTGANGLGAPPKWVQLAPTGSPGSDTATAIYNASTNQLTTFAGISYSNNMRTNEVWTLEHANGLGGSPSWKEVFPTGVPPTPRQNATSAFDGRNRMIVFGGDNLNDSWVLTNP